VRVVGKLGAQGKRYTYGVAFVNRRRTSWDSKVPSMTESERQAGRVLLQCAAFFKAAKQLSKRPGSDGCTS